MIPLLRQRLGCGTVLLFCALVSAVPLSGSAAAGQESASIFGQVKDESGAIFHSYSSYSRGGEMLLGIYGMLDMMPKGRNETGPSHTLGDWARPHTKYGQGGEVEGDGGYHAPACGCGAHG